MNRLSTGQRAHLVERNSIRATSRISGIAYATVIKFVADIVRACTEYQSGAHNLPLRPQAGIG
jgi:hypothetical protein